MLKEKNMEQRASELISAGLRRQKLDVPSTEIGKIVSILKFSEKHFISTDSVNQLKSIQSTNRNTQKSAMTLAHLMRKILDCDEIEPLYDLPTQLSLKLNFRIFPMEFEFLNYVLVFINHEIYLFIPSQNTERGTTVLDYCGEALGRCFSYSEKTMSRDYCFFDCGLKQNKIAQSKIEFFSTRFSRDLLVTETALTQALLQVKKSLNANMNNIGDIEILYLSRIFGVGFLTIAKVCEDLKLLPTGSAITLLSFLENNFGSPEVRAEKAGLPDPVQIKVPVMPLQLIEQVSRGLSSSDISPEEIYKIFGYRTKQGESSTIGSLH